MRPLILLSLFGNWDATPAQKAAITIMVILFIGGIVISYFYIKNKQKLEHKNLMKIKYDKYLLNLTLTDEELHFIAKLSKFLENDELKYNMLTNKRSFSNCVSELQKVEKCSKVLVNTIERKLNFPVRRAVNHYFSSEDLPVGMPALVMPGDGKKLAGNISENTQSSITLKLKNKSVQFRDTMRVSVYFHDNQKIFIINSTVQEQNDDLLSLTHSLLKSQKRRAFKRKRIKLPIVIKHLDYEEIPLHSYIINLSEGGASLENPDFKFKKNDRVILYYHIDTEEGFHIRAEVLRLSAKGRIMHVHFLDRDLTIRSRIKIIIK